MENQAHRVEPDAVEVKAAHGGTPGSGRGRRGNGGDPQHGGDGEGGPNPENAKKLIEYLVSAEVEAMLAKCDSVQMPLRPGVPPPGERFDLGKIKIMEIDWEDAATRFEAVKTFITQELMW